MKIGIITSGGDAPGMNAAIRAIVRTAKFYGHEVVAFRNGYKGILEDDFVEIEFDRISGLLVKGGTFLGTSRVDSFKEIAVKKIAIQNLIKHSVDVLIAIGGDGTFLGARELSKLGMKCVSIPATIDNDIVGTDMAIGFSTALETIVEAIDKLRDTSSAHGRCSILETMGRHRGDLALFAGICGGAELIITPENKMSSDEIVLKMKQQFESGRKHAIIIVTEKLFNVFDLANKITIESGFSTRATVLGYLQRGGKPSPADRILASRLGVYAVELLHQGIFNCLVGVSNDKMIYSDYDNLNIEKDYSKVNDLYDIVNKIS